MSDPIIGVIFRRDQHPAAKRLEDLASEDRVSAVACDAHVPLSEALATEWAEDAHLIAYRVDADQEGEEYVFARVSKRSAFTTQLLSRGGRITVSMLVFDHDLPGHAEWTERSLADFLEGLGAGTIPEPSAWYTTLHGSRFIFVLWEAVDHLKAEGLARGIIRDFKRNAGIELDSACVDWTRLFRLPRTVRQDTGATFATSPFFLLLDGGPDLDASSIEPEAAGGNGEVYADIDPYAGTAPDPEEVRELLTRVGANNRVLESDWVKDAKVYLKGREAFGPCFDHQDIDTAKGWNNGVFKFISQVVGMTARLDLASPERIYALTFPAIEQLQAVEDREAQETNWFEKAWDMICRMWSNEMAQIEAEAQEREQKLLEAKEASGELIDQLREVRPDDVPVDPDEAQEWFKSRMIASDGQRHYLMRRDGSYNVKAVPTSLIVPMIRDLDMAELIPLFDLKGKNFVPRNSTEIINDHATPITSVQCSAREKVAYISGEAGYRSLHVPVHRLNPIVLPVFSREVDDWLRALGGERYDLLVDWLAHSLAAAEPICALNLYGPPGTGKGMLVQGLAECFEGEKFSDGRALDRFNVGLLDSPIISCDEGVPIIKGLGTTVDQTFRTMVSGGTLPIEGKMKDIITANIYPRVVFTSNDRDILRSIVGHRDLTDDDIRAIEQRILTIKVQDAAFMHLTRLGNYAHTAGWVHGRNKSQYVLASHIRYLFEHRRPSQHTTGRFLVEGQTNTTLIRSLRLRSKGAQTVLRALLKMVESPTGRKGLHLFESRVWVTPAGVVEYIESAFNSMNVEAVTLPRCGQVLRQFAILDEDPGKVPLRQPPGLERAQRARWIEVDLGIMYEEGLRYGMTVSRVEQMLRSRPDGPLKIAMAHANLPDVEE